MPSREPTNWWLVNPEAAKLREEILREIERLPYEWPSEDFSLDMSVVDEAYQRVKKRRRRDAMWKRYHRRRLVESARALERHRKALQEWT